MVSKKVVIYLPEGFADWEGAFLMPELVEAKCDFMTVTDSGRAVRSIGGLRVQPDAALSEIARHEMKMLILIGSDTWVDPKQNQKALQLALQVFKQKTLLAGICGATTGLARTGVFETCLHTSNDLGMLKKLVPDYTSEKNYVHKLAVSDQNLITATGIAPLEFTFEILKALDIYSEQKRQQWFAMYKNGVMPPLEFWS